nr:MAG TPA: hypothetical protein [Caudoviricetes sp.]
MIRLAIFHLQENREKYMLRKILIKPIDEEELSM